MQVPFTLVDVFTSEPFAGNQLCVVPEPPPELDTTTMQLIAQEIGFSETTFVGAVRDAGYDVRIFTPVEELPFAGHPTLGTAFVLADRGAIPSDVVQTCAAGDVPVWVDLPAGSATMRQLPAVFGNPVEDRDAVAAAAGLSGSDLGDHPLVPVSTGIAHLMVPVVEEDALRRASRDDHRCAEVTERADAESLYLFTERGPGDLLARMFDRSIQIGEDPATGSAAGPLACTWPSTGSRGCRGTSRSPRARWSDARRSSRSTSPARRAGGSRAWGAACGSWARARSGSRSSSPCS